MTAPLQLPGVTLVSVTSVKLAETQGVLQHCLSRMRFGAVKLLCPEMPDDPDPRIEYLRMPKIDLKGYNWILLRLLHRHIATPHCLIVQADGFILAPERWEAGFLDYDYIGAPWAPSIFVAQKPSWTLELDRNRIGNGGFSLRSKRLMEAVAALPAEAFNFPVMSEDVVVCHYLYEYLCSRGFRFAPLEVAARFAVETENLVPGQAVGTVFGFHGDHLMEKAQAIMAGERPCACGSGERFADCHGRLWK